jgi:hypothetical protein
LERAAAAAAAAEATEQAQGQGSEWDEVSALLEEEFGGEQEEEKEEQAQAGDEAPECDQVRYVLFIPLDAACF